MAKLIHLCQKCGHSQHWHSERTGGFTLCPCCKREPVSENLDPTPTLVETYELGTGVREPLAQPGSVYNAGTQHRENLCACAACEAAYAEAVSA